MMRKKKETDQKLAEEKKQLREDIRKMSFSKKLEYFLMYDKWILVAAAICAIVVYFGIDWYRNAQVEEVLTVATAGGTIPDEKVVQRIEETLGIDGDPHKVVSVLSPLTGDEEGALNYYSQINFMTRVQARELDVLLMSETYAKGFQKEGYFQDPSDYLTKEQAGRMKEDISGSCVLLKNNPEMAALGMYTEPVYYGILITSRNTETAVQWLEALYDLNGSAGETVD